MNTQKRPLGKTHVTQSFPWGLYRRNGHRAICSDGVIRAVEMAETADTYFSVPASVRIAGKRYTGYVTGEETREGGRCYSFRHHVGENVTPVCPLPAWPHDGDAKEEILLNAI